MPTVTETYFNWKQLPDSLKVRFSMVVEYKKHTFVLAETLPLSEAAWQSIDGVVRTMKCRLKGKLLSIIKEAIDYAKI